MKFLLELVPCCGSPTATQRKVPGLPPPLRPHELEDDDDVTSLVPPPLPPPPQRRIKRVRTVADARSRSTSLSVQWSPSLGVISEDRVVTTTAKGLATGQRNVAVAELAGSVRAGTGRRTSGGGGGGSNNAADRWRAHDRDRRRRDRDDYEYGRSTLTTTMIPAFSPTPFLF